MFSRHSKQAILLVKLFFKKVGAKKIFFASMVKTLYIILYISVHFNYCLKASLAWFLLSHLLFGTDPDRNGALEETPRS